MHITLALLGKAAKRAGFTALTTKRGGKGYYKGKGAIPTGRHTQAGRERLKDLTLDESGPTLTPRVYCAYITQPFPPPKATHSSAGSLRLLNSSV